ncbi:MAG: hypothetical protein MJZ21_02330 [archaeon]|nr:hypothetical protein [archaeon]
MSELFNSRPAKRNYTCAVCSATWAPKKKEGLPNRCPRCKSKLWNTCYRHKCILCGHDWMSANAVPDRCPGCQSKKWQDKGSDISPSTFAPIPNDLRRPILLRYDAGMGCIKIAIDLAITFGEVMDIVIDAYPNIEPRL